jgi:hypothetical protein
MHILHCTKWDNYIYRLGTTSSTEYVLYLMRFCIKVMLVTIFYIFIMSHVRFCDVTKLYIFSFSHLNCYSKFLNLR